MIKTLIMAAVLIIGATATAEAQCHNCKPQTPTAQAAPAPQYVWVRRGLFRCRWVLTPVYPMAQGQIIGYAQR